MREDSPIPYRSGYTPPKWIDRHPDFTNPDPRLRPSIVLRPLPSGPRDFLVTKYNFPALYKRFDEMCEQAGLDPKPLLLISDRIPFVGRYKDNVNAIYLNLSVVNGYTWEQLLAMPLGHEVGHAWRHQNPNAADFPIPKQATSRRQSEYEATMLSVCVNNGVENMLAWMHSNHHGQPDIYPTNAELLESMERLPWSACPFPSGPVNLRPPPLLRAPDVKQK